MAIESTGSGEELLAAVEALGWPAVGSSRGGRPLRAARFGPGHAPFACINYDGPAAAWAQAVAAACGWPARADIGYPTPGSLGSWLGLDRRLPVITLELPPGDHARFAQEAQRAL